MKSNALEYNTWDDIVFDSRNKRYGAYIIRKLYNSYVMFSALIAVSIFLFFMGLPFFISLIMGKHKEEEKVYKTVIQIKQQYPNWVLKNLYRKSYSSYEPPSSIYEYVFNDVNMDRCYTVTE